MTDIAPGVLVRGEALLRGLRAPDVGKLSFNGYPLLHSKALAKRINADGPLSDEQVRALSSELAHR